MIQTKLFSGYFVQEGNSSRTFIDIDKEINQFFKNTPGIEYIDIKYSVSVDASGESWNNALLIYKEEK